MMQLSEREQNWRGAAHPMADMQKQLLLLNRPRSTDFLISDGEAERSRLITPIEPGPL